MFAGFRSRRMIPCSCAASSASAICFAMGSASASGIAARDECRQILALDQFHHEGLRATRSFEAVDRRDVGMIQRREDLGFALEAGDAIGITREGLGKNLDRHAAAKLRIASAIHLAHPAGAEGGLDLIRTEPSTGTEGHTCVDRCGNYRRAEDVAESAISRRAARLKNCHTARPASRLRPHRGAKRADLRPISTARLSHFRRQRD